VTVERVVSLLPSATEIVAALGCGDRLVGRSHECDFPPGVERLPVCTRPRVDVSGSSAAIDKAVRGAVADALAVYEVLEGELRRLKPSTIVTQDQCEVCAVSLSDVEACVAAWSGRPVKLVSLRARTLAGVYDDILGAAEALGVGDTGEAVVAAFAGRNAAIAAAARSLRMRPRVACIEWTAPLMAAGNWVPEMVAMAGGRDLFGQAGEYAPALTPEALRAADPDAIVFMPCGFGLERARAEAGALAAATPGWHDLAAVRAGRVYATDANSFFNRPGPRLAESLEIMAEILHPEAFHFGHEGKGWTRIAA
jgi:iron complex transport system substrate-binding protein